MPTLTLHTQAGTLGAQDRVHFKMTALFSEHLPCAFKPHGPLQLTDRVGTSTGLFLRGKLGSGQCGHLFKATDVPGP